VVVFSEALCQNAPSCARRPKRCYLIDYSLMENPLRLWCCALIERDEADKASPGSQSFFDSVAQKSERLHSVGDYALDHLVLLLEQPQRYIKVSENSHSPLSTR